MTTTAKTLSELAGDVFDPLVELGAALVERAPELKTSDVLAALCTLYNLCHHLADDDLHRHIVEQGTCEHCKPSAQHGPTD